MAPRLVYVVTHPVTAHGLLRGQLAYMRERGFDVTVIASPGAELEEVGSREGVRVVAVPIERRIDPRKDARSLQLLTSVLRLLAPHIVNASTPKAGLLGLLAARALRVPVRIYLLRGLRLETTRGILRRVLSASERITAACAHEVVCNSTSVRDAAVEGGHIPGEKARLLGRGSSNGFDVDRWERTPARVAAGQRWGLEHGIDPRAEMIGFVGRFDPDKGLPDLLDAFELLRRDRPSARLVLVGGGYADDLDPTLEARLRRAVGVLALGKTSDLAPVYARMDVLAFPSYREGFPNVPLEAACAGVPAVGYRVTGVVDAVVDGETGTLVEARDVAAFSGALARYLSDPGLRSIHGGAARDRAVRDFSHAAVWGAWERYYRQRLARLAG